MEASKVILFLNDINDSGLMMLLLINVIKRHVNWHITKNNNDINNINNTVQNSCAIYVINNNMY